MKKKKKTNPVTVTRGKKNMENKKGQENITFSLWKYTKTIQNIPPKYQKTYSIPNIKQKSERWPFWFHSTMT